MDLNPKYKAVLLFLTVGNVFPSTLEKVVNVDPDPFTSVTNELLLLSNKIGSTLYWLAK
ncbi:hypothetical protein D3C81_1934350 [compost metagenome]